MNTQNINAETYINTRQIIVPDKLPKYSIYNDLKERDEFRKSVELELHNTKSKENKSYLTKFLTVCAAIGTLLALEYKKII